MLLAQWAIEEGMPLLGVCRGVQVMNVVCGGTLWQDLTAQTPEHFKHDYFPPTFERFRISHQINVAPESHLASAVGSVQEVNSMHHQGIRKVGAGLRVVGTAADGLPEALEVPELPFTVGVQWHPEELAKTDELSAGLFLNFVHAAAGEWREQVPADWGEHWRNLGETGTNGGRALAREERREIDAAALSTWATANQVAGSAPQRLSDLRANCA